MGWLYDTMPDGSSLRMKTPAIGTVCCARSPLRVKSVLATVVVVLAHKCIVAAVEVGALCCQLLGDFYCDPTHGAADSM